jgi:hypothetical protein
MHKSSNTHNDSPSAGCRQIYRSAVARCDPGVANLDAVQVTVLDAVVWQDRRSAHERRVDGWLASHRDRRRNGRKHPVEDFLFTYYSYRPSQLRRWHPGIGLGLVGADLDEFGSAYRVDADGAARVDIDKALARRRAAWIWIAALLRRTATRPAHFGCFGMHEWAMVYRLSPAEIRHADWPLRLSADDTAAVVEANRVNCSHFDAYRFFTPAARPLNALALTRESQPDLDQPGCLHANMDLYKWAYKLSPLTGSDLVADGFELARDIRTLDMRASPYDLADLGFSPVAVETAAGRTEYVRAQREFAERAASIRAQLIDVVDAVDLGDPVR